VPLCKSAGTKELKVVHGASATCVLQNADSGLECLGYLDCGPALSEVDSSVVCSPQVWPRFFEGPFPFPQKDHVFLGMSSTPWC